jgi:hypothetical protein
LARGDDVEEVKLDVVLIEEHRGAVGLRVAVDEQHTRRCVR